jgi:uncharacterized protein involved in type VI secretion and phage assembly
MIDPLEITISLGKSVLAVVRLKGREEISQLFRFSVDAVSPSAEPLSIRSIFTATASASSSSSTAKRICSSSSA